MPKGDSSCGISIVKSGDRLILSTSNFRPDQGSVLHSGIYNREFSSMLASVAAAVLSYPIVAFFIPNTSVLYLSLAMIAVFAFPLFRKYIFRDKTLKVIFDRAAKSAEISVRGMASGKTDLIPFDSIKKILLDKKTPEIINPDGVEFVKKISLQHGSVIPGFGDETPFYILKLLLSDGTDRVLYSDRSMDRVMEVYDRINGFIKIDENMRGQIA